MLGKQLQTAAAGNAGGGALGIEDVFSTYLYTGTGSNLTITNGIDLAGEGGLVWIKVRDDTYNHTLMDTERGVNKYLASNTTSGEGTSTTYMSSFNSDGFTVVSEAPVNNWAGNPFVSWTFRKAPGFFDVVTWTGNGTSQNISHSLGDVPGCIIVKNRVDTDSWNVYHRSLGTGYFMFLNSTAGPYSATDRFTAVSSTTFSIGSNPNLNESGQTYVAYLFAHDAQIFGENADQSVIKCGSYTGNDTSQTVSLGWEPQWLLVKRASGGTANWLQMDTMRGMPAATTGGKTLYPNLSNAEGAAGYFQPRSTGFYLEGNSTDHNASGDTYVYIAIRRGPMKTPTDATEVFNAIARSGTGTSSLVVNTTIQPDTIIQTYRNTGAANDIYDRLRGAGVNLQTTSISGEGSNAPNYGPQVFGNTSYTQGNLDGSNYNSSGNTFIDWVFRRAPGFFDVVAYTGDGNGFASQSHGLGVAPEMLIVKPRNSSSYYWSIYHSALGASKDIRLASSAKSNSVLTWGYTPPTSSVFYTEGPASNQSGTTYIAYLFATLPGVSKVGSYTGTAATLNVDCGFSAGARFVLIKRTDDTGNWYVWDTARGIVAGNDPSLFLNAAGAELTSNDYIDPYSAGFTITSTAPTDLNASGGSYIFLAIA